jgi:hypothetical protein
MPDLIIRIKKKTDGAAALSCTRANGSVTWQRQDGQVAAFFPFHDLSHYAVETGCGFTRGFYGLIAEGWDISDFSKDGRKGPIPDEARLVEVIVSQFDLERLDGDRPDAAELEARVRSYYADKDQPLPSFEITQEQVDRVREIRAGAIARWKAVPPGEVIELSFDRARVER